MNLPGSWKNTFKCILSQEILYSGWRIYNEWEKYSNWKKKASGFDIITEKLKEMPLNGIRFLMQSGENYYDNEAGENELLTC